MYYEESYDLRHNTSNNSVVCVWFWPGAVPRGAAPQWNFAPLWPPKKFKIRSSLAIYPVVQHESISYVPPRWKCRHPSGPPTWKPQNRHCPHQKTGTINWHENRALSYSLWKTGSVWYQKNLVPNCMSYVPETGTGFQWGFFYYVCHEHYANETRTRNRRQKPVSKNR